MIITRSILANSLRKVFRALENWKEEKPKTWKVAKSKSWNSKTWQV